MPHNLRARPCPIATCALALVLSLSLSAAAAPRARHAPRPNPAAIMAQPGARTYLRLAGQTIPVRSFVLSRGGRSRSAHSLTVTVPAPAPGSNWMRSDELRRRTLAAMTLVTDDAQGRPRLRYTFRNVRVSGMTLSSAAGVADGLAIVRLTYLGMSWRVL